MKPVQKNKVEDSNSSAKVAIAGPTTFRSNEFIKKQKQLMKRRNISTTSSLPLFKFNIIPGLLVCLGCTLFNPIATYVISISQVNNFQASLTFLSKLLSCYFLFFLVIPNIPLFYRICFLLLKQTHRCYWQFLRYHMCSLRTKILVHLSTTHRWNLF